MKSASLINELNNLWCPAADKEKSKQMAAYMKGKFAFLGLPSPVRRRLQKPVIKKARLLPWPEMKLWVEDCWRADAREFQYAAIDVLKNEAGRIALDDAAWMKQLITTKSWWDSVDFLAIYLSGHFVRNFPEKGKALMFSWSTHENRWLRRTSILHQLSFKSNTDVELLEKIILNNQADRDFFIRKAIGWALREYARVDPDWVRRQVKSHAYSPLTRREALKNLSKNEVY